MNKLGLAMILGCTLLGVQPSFGDIPESKVVVFIHGDKSVALEDLQQLEAAIILKGYNLREPDSECDVVSDRGVEYFAPQYLAHAQAIAGIANDQISGLPFAARKPLQDNFIIGTKEIRKPGLPYIDLWLCN